MSTAHDRAELTPPIGAAGVMSPSASELTALAEHAVRTRDPATVRRFLEGIAPVVRGVCRAVMGPRHADLEDAIQECLIEILRALPKYRFEGTIVGYASRIALRCSIAARKRGRNREERARVLAELEAVTATCRRQEAGPGLWFLCDVIDELPKVQAEAVVMRMVLGYTVEEIAVATHVSANTSKSRLRVAKEYLRRRLDGEA
ncbi:MAG: sigma-70 family RNA polymerase sigma factor [Pseudomonadota bacterium]|jgi:RNA polymerase sigma-70 factor, ECF subfamily